MEVIDARPTYLKSKRLPWEELKLMPVGDLQFGAPGCDVDRLKRHLDWGLRNDVMFIGMGDYHDFLSPSNRKYLMHAGLYDTAADLIEEWYMKHLEQLKEILEPTRGRWIGLLEGHHYFEFSDGGTTDTELARYLDTVYLGDCAMVRLTFEKGRDRASCVLWAHHGQGGGGNANAGSILNKLESISSGFEADIYLMGHASKVGASPIDRLEVTGKGEPLLRSRTKMLVATGAFMRSYQQGSKRMGRAQGSYPEQGMMKPVTLGGPVISITPRHGKRHYELDIKCSV